MNTVVVVPLSTNILLADFPGNVLIDKNVSKLSKESVAVVSQLVVIDKLRFVEKVSKLSFSVLNKISVGIKLVLDL